MIGFFFYVIDLTMGTSRTTTSTEHPTMRAYVDDGNDDNDDYDDEKIG